MAITHWRCRIDSDEDRTRARHSSTGKRRTSKTQVSPIIQQLKRMCGVKVQRHCWCFFHADKARWPQLAEAISNGKNSVRHSPCPSNHQENGLGGEKNENRKVLFRSAA